MNRIAIDIDVQGNLVSVASDTECRIFIINKECVSEPVYELTEGIGKNTGVRFVRALIGDNLAATMDSDTPLKDTKPDLGGC